MITSKQRAALRAMANQMDAIFQIGKGGINDALINQVDDALRVRELIKMSILETSPITAKEAAQVLAEAVNAEIVQVIGGKLVLYKKNPKEPKIILK